MKTIQELRKLDVKALEAEEKDLRKKGFQLKFELSNGIEKGAHLYKQSKKNIARIQTLKSSLRKSK